MATSGARILVDVLEQSGVDTVFGVVGTTVLEILDEIGQNDEIRYISARHEHVSASMAAGYSLATRKPSVSISHVGPGAANQVIGIVAAYRDNIPVISVTGNEEIHTLGHDVNHEWDVMGVFERFTDYNVQLDYHDPFRDARHAALQSITGMPSTVHIDVPEDVAESDHDSPTQRALDEIADLASDGRASRSSFEPSTDAIARAVDLLEQANRPLIVAGSEFRWFGGTALLREFAESHDIPVVTAQNARGALDETHPLSLGYIANTVIDSGKDYASTADYILAVGTVLTDKITSSWTLFDDEASLVHATVRSDQLDRYLSADVSIIGDPHSTLSAVIDEVDDRDVTLDFSEVANDAGTAVEQERQDLLTVSDSAAGVDPRHVVKVVDELLDDFAYTLGGGVHGVYTKLLPVRDLNARFVTANFAGMAQGLPLAMGAKLALPDREVLAFEGDGGFAMVMQDLETVVREEIPIKIVILNNDAYMSHAVRQEARYGRHIGTYYTNPPFDRVAENFGMYGEAVRDNDEVEGAFERLFALEEPGLLDVHIDPEIGAESRKK